MKLKPIIRSLMETDAYKFSMGQVIFHQFNSDRTRWLFRCRNKDVKFTPAMVKEIKEQIDHYCTLRFTDTELEWLNVNLPWITRDYTDFLRFWHPRREEIYINETTEHVPCGLHIETSGTWLNTSMYEIAILAIVNEVYFAFTEGAGAWNSRFVEATVDKFDRLASKEFDIGTFSEFGLRRRYSAEMQDWLLYYIRELGLPGFVGTSNVYLAMQMGLKATGTQAHEFIMCVGQGHHEYNPAYSNRFALEAWVKEYQTDNGIALTDTITTDAFLCDFNKHYAAVFSGVRHDSGDPIEWGEKMLVHYNRCGIDPTLKTLLFSDGLDFEKATAIRRHFDGRAKVAFGIGTYLSNPRPDPLNIVMKVVECNGAPVAKISDVEGKGMCQSEEYVRYLNRAIEWRLASEARQHVATLGCCSGY